MRVRRRRLEPQGALPRSEAAREFLQEPCSEPNGCTRTFVGSHIRWSCVQCLMGLLASLSNSTSQTYVNHRTTVSLSHQRILSEKDTTTMEMHCQLLQVPSGLSTVRAGRSLRGKGAAGNASRALAPRWSIRGRPEGVGEVLVPVRTRPGAAVELHVYSNDLALLCSSVLIIPMPGFICRCSPA